MSLLSVFFSGIEVTAKRRTKHRHYHARGTAFAFRKKTDAQSCLQRYADYLEIHGVAVERINACAWSINNEEDILYIDPCDVKGCAS